MTAYELIDSIFKRPHAGLAGNKRRLTKAQLRLLVQLIGESSAAAAFAPGVGDSGEWKPPGHTNYALVEDLTGDMHTITKLSKLAAGASGTLF